MVKALKIFAYIYGTLAVMLIGAGLVGVWMTDGFSAVHPNYLVIIITLSPAIGAHVWAERIEAKKAFPKEQP